MAISIFQTHKPVVGAVSQFLRLLKADVTQNTVADAILSHPDYPSMLPISDGLNTWNIENAALRVTGKTIDELPVPFVTFIEGDFRVVTAVTDKEVSFLDEENKTRIEPKIEFINLWNGVALLAETGENSGEKDYGIKKTKENLESFRGPALLGIGILLLVFAMVSFTLNNTLSSAISYCALLLAKFGGVLITSLLLWYEIDKFNPALKKICSGAGQKSDCNAILNSSQAKVFSWLSWSEVGFFYFSGGFLTLLLSPQFMGIIVWLNILALPYVVFSISYQAFVAKQWCPLCLAVQGLLCLECIIALTGHLFDFSMVWSSFIDISFIKAGLVFLIPSAVWFFFKPSLLNEKERENDKYELNRLKNNEEVFRAVMARQRQIDTDTEGLGITLGNPNAKNTLIKVCNPYCDPCSKAHPEVEKLLETNTKIQIIYNVSNQDFDFTRLPVKHFFAIADKKDLDLLSKSLNEWYNDKVKDYEKFAKKYPVDDIEKYGVKIDDMRQWCNGNNVSFTPSYFLNGRKVPDYYKLSDLKHFLT